MSRKAYKSDLSDAHWEVLKPLIPAEKFGGRPRTVDLREVLNGIFYVLRTGCSWEMMPNDLPHLHYGLLLLSSLAKTRRLAEDEQYSALPSPSK
jgi:hypothetical protein